MSRYRQVHCLIWNDDKFPFLSDDAKLIFFHVLTTPFSNAIGCFKVSLEALAAELRWSLKRYRKGFRELFQKGLVKYDENHQVILIPNFIKYNPPPNGNVIKSWAKLWHELPSSPLKFEFYQLLKRFIEPLGERFMKSFNEGFGNGMAIQEQEQEQEQDKNNNITPSGVIVAKAESFDDHRPPPCPHKQIIELYHEILPELPRVKEWNESRRKYLQARWREKPERQSLDWWRKYFEYVRESDFLMGRKDPPPGRDPFRADLEWLIRQQNMTKVLEGKYHRRAREPTREEKIKRVQEILNQKHGGSNAT